MKPVGISLHRISSAGQSEGHSLEAQNSSTALMAESMGVEIIKVWSIVQSSKKGKNFSRKDLQEILAFAKQNRHVKYLFLDRVNRLMREMMAMIHYIVELDALGVKVVFCDSSQQYLNGGDQLSQLMLIIEAFKAEQENNERAQTTIARMKARYSAGYYLSHPHAGYKKSDTPGIHLPDELRFSLLQKGSRLIIYEQYTLPQAVRWMNENGYRTIGGKKLDVNHYTEFIADRYYCGIIDIKKEGPLDDIQGAKGLHQRMFSEREHELLVGIITKRNPRIRQQHNPEFPVGNLMRHYECMDIGKYEKFTGFYKNRGKRPNGKQRNKLPVYRCRDCRKEISRGKLHDGTVEHLHDLELVPSEKDFREALVRVWRRQRGSVTQRLNVLETNKASLEQKIKETAAAYAQEQEGGAKNALKLLLDDYDNELKRVRAEITTTRDVELESEDFVKFAMGFAENLKNNWWELSWDNRKRGEQILFNGKIYADNSAKVHTPALSSIYRLGTNKKDLGEVSLSNMVELRGIAPRSESSLTTLLQA